MSKQMEVENVTAIAMINFIRDKLIIGGDFPENWTDGDVAKDYIEEAENVEYVLTELEVAEMLNAMGFYMGNVNNESEHK